MTDEERGRRLLEAIEYGGPTHTLADIIELIDQGRAKFWENDEASVITEIREFPLMKQLNLWLISGELEHCLALEEEILAWGVEQGCSVATACGRKGWAPIVAKRGWRQWHPTFWKPLVPDVNYGRRL